MIENRSFAGSRQHVLALPTPWAVSYFDLFPRTTAEMREGRLLLLSLLGLLSHHPLLYPSSEPVEEERASFTCSVASVVEIHGEGPRLVHRLPRGGRAVLIVCVDVVVVHILPCEHGWPWRAAHGCGHKGIGEGGPTVLHDLSCFVHDLQRTWKAEFWHRLAKHTPWLLTSDLTLKHLCSLCLLVSLHLCEGVYDMLRPHF